MKLIAPLALALTAATAAAQVCTMTSVGQTPIDDLGTGTYAGFQGGLYPGGSNVRPAAHLAAGLAETAFIVPRDATGAPSVGGKIVFMSIGMSNTNNEWTQFIPLALSDPLKRPEVVVVQGAQGGQAAQIIASAAAPYWSFVDGQVTAAGCTNAQVQAIWLKEAHSNPSGGFPAESLALQADLTSILQILRTKFVNLRAVYLSSRIYAGYTTTTLSPETYAYEGGFAAKWTIEAQITGAPALNFDSSLGPVLSSWVTWGPYLWADGIVPRSDGLTWLCSDYISDGTHPNVVGSLKVANRILAMCDTDPTTAWYRTSTPPPPGTSVPFCAGDGIDASVTVNCPCGNFGSPGRGCAHSQSPAGAYLGATGNPVPDTIVLHSSGMPAATIVLFLQHAVLGQQVFHDGVICANGQLLRLRQKQTQAGYAEFPSSTDTITLSARGGVTPGSGAIRYYTAFYRNTASTFCPPATANVSNGWQITW